MSSLQDVFASINRLLEAGVIEAYAVGGATAVLFYAEPARTYDVDVFVIVRGAGQHELAPLAGIYDWARAQGYRTEAEHVLIDGVPVQFLPAYTALVEESIREARPLTYGSEPVRVVGPEHLVALALQAGGARRRERAYQLLESGDVDRARLLELLTRHGLPTEILDGA
ncbi:MAG: nucleotidyltransferase [Acidobacteria bacterium]|nr:nucleotidyltransferase [Acidobacteriota bacterium]